MNCTISKYIFELLKPLLAVLLVLLGCYFLFVLAGVMLMFVLDNAVDEHVDHRTNSGLIANFEHYEQCYSKIITMVQEDGNISKIYPTWYAYSNNKSHLDAPERIQEYRKVFEECNDTEGISVKSDGSVLILEHPKEQLHFTSMQGYYYAEQALRFGEVEEKDGRETYRVEYGGDAYAEYIHIRGNWYTYYEYYPQNTDDEY